MPRIHANGVDFFYVEAGKGAPLVLLGRTLGAAEADFAPQIEAFSRDFRVIAPERRGYGRTRPPERDFPDDFYQRDADDMAAAMAALGIGRATVLGWSEGADVSMCLARAHPERVGRLVFWGGIAAVREADLAVFETSRDGAAWPARARDAMSALYEEAYWTRVYGGWCDTMQRLFAQGGDVRLGPIENIACPTLILHGGKDALIARYHPAALQARIPGATLHEIDGAGHNAHLSHTDEFHRVAGAFLRAGGGHDAA